MTRDHITRSYHTITSHDDITRGTRPPPSVTSVAFHALFSSLNNILFFFYTFSLPQLFLCLPGGIDTPRLKLSRSARAALVKIPDRPVRSRPPLPLCSPPPRRLCNTRPCSPGCSRSRDSDRCRLSSTRTRFRSALAAGHRRSEGRMERAAAVTGSRWTARRERRGVPALPCGLSSPTSRSDSAVFFRPGFLGGEGCSCWGWIDTRSGRQSVRPLCAMFGLGVCTFVYGSTETLESCVGASSAALPTSSGLSLFAYVLSSRPDGADPRKAK